MIYTDNSKVNENLLEENDRLKELAEKLQGMLDVTNNGFRDLVKENAILKAENISLKSENKRILRACEKVEVAFKNIKKVDR